MATTNFKDAVIFGEIVELSPEEVAANAAWEAGAHDRAVEAVKQARQAAYQQTADPLFFQYQAGEATEQQWLDARAAVVEAHPYPEETN
jgi:hypothetical protein